MPVAGVNVGKSPADAIEAQPTGYIWIFVNVIVVVEVNEVVPKSLAKGDPDERYKENADNACRQATPSLVHLNR